jgi:hypothetical protein
MPQLIRPQTKIVQTVTKEGEVEVTIKMDITINLASDGLVLAQAQGGSQGGNSFVSDNDKVEWAIPDFGDTEKVDFGKKDK